MSDRAEQSISANQTTALGRRSAIAAGALAIALAVGIYTPVLYYMALHWNQVADYSHGFLIVPLALYFAWERRDLLRVATIEGSWLGLLPLTAGVISLTIGRLGVELTTMRWGFVLTLIGLVALLFGRQVVRILAFPLLFLFLMVPLPQSLVNTVTFPMQLIAASGAVQSLHWMGIPALLEGNIIHLAEAELFVAEACSGLRSLMALLTLGVVFAYFFRQSTAERAIIVVSTLPIAIFVNSLRVGLTGVLAHFFGADSATGAIHDFQGLITFSVALVLLLGEAQALGFLWPQMERMVRPRRNPA